MNKLDATVAQITSEIILLKQQTAQNIIEIGRRLIQAKEALPHGKWETWLETSVDFKKTTASKFMRVANEFANVQTYEHLTQSKIFALLDVPTEQREEFVSKPHEVDGQKKTVDEMTTRELQRAIKERKQEQKQRLEAERRAKQAEEERQQLERKYQQSQRYAQELEARKPKVVEKVIEKEVVPQDYHRLKSEVEEAKQKLYRTEVEMGEIAAAHVATKNKHAARSSITRFMQDVNKGMAELEFKMKDPATLEDDLVNDYLDKMVEMLNGCIDKIEGYKMNKGGFVDAKYTIG